MGNLNPLVLLERTDARKQVRANNKTSVVLGDLSKQASILSKQLSSNRSACSDSTVLPVPSPSPQEMQFATKYNEIKAIFKDASAMRPGMMRMGSLRNPFLKAEEAPPPPPPQVINNAIFKDASAMRPGAMRMGSLRNPFLKTEQAPPPPSPPVMNNGQKVPSVVLGGFSKQNSVMSGLSLDHSHATSSLNTSISGMNKYHL
mmetsp:Transcript_55576/g.66822  ORF Transcript_55576/g.66822 Transcript_55576/m.66822 type:complete len:202 (+) Transcript_55576:538-1143(+)